MQARSRSSAYGVSKLIFLLGGTALLGSAAALAQSSSRSFDSDEPAADIIVTGSSIRGAAPVGSNVVSVGAVEIESTPAQSVQQILKSVPSITGLNSAGQGAFQSNDASGMSAPSIHGLGGSASTSTLVLIDGHRFPLGGVTHGLADPNLIPSIAIERVEVLADGASSVYGSDAAAGVINFITRSRFDGVQVTGQMGFGSHYKTQNATLLAGTVWDTGSVYLAVAHSKRDALLRGHRSFMQADHRPQGGAVILQASIVALHRFKMRAQI